MRRKVGRRLERLEHQYERGCSTCRRWVGAVLMDDDGTLSRSEWCPDCGRFAPATETLHIVGVPVHVP
jgi:hypothetical protein